jgi:SAM-dependent methyltransferase
MIAFHTNKGTASQPRFWPDYWKTVSLQFDSRYLPEYPLLMRHLAPAARVLDVGCGRGIVVRELLRLGHKARGIDFDADSIFDSVAHAGYFPGEVGDLNLLPYRDDSFDAVLLAGTIEHVFDGPERGCAEVFRVLRPGGVMVLTIPYINIVRKTLLPFYTARDILYSFFPERRKERFFEWVFTRAEVFRLLTRAGFSVCECRRAYYTTVLRKIPGVIRASEFVFGRPRLSNGAAPRNSSRDSSSSPRTKAFLKRMIEGTLNMIMPNRLLVVARKPAASGGAV